MKRKVRFRPVPAIGGKHELHDARMYTTHQALRPAGVAFSDTLRRSDRRRAYEPPPIPPAGWTLLLRRASEKSPVLRLLRSEISAHSLAV